jgi:periplasmic divalent cation tolerance protein
MKSTPEESEAVILLSTIGTEDQAKELARPLVDGRLAACVTMLPGARSIYRWRDAVTEEAEVVLLMKTTRDRVPALRARIQSLHPYEVPEILVLGVEEGSRDYLAWLRDSTRSPLEEA